MSTTTLEPDSTISTSGVVVNGAANVHTALSDDTDASYISGFDAGVGSLRCGLPDLAIPSTSAVRGVSAEVRAARTSPPTNARSMRITLLPSSSVSGENAWQTYTLQLSSSTPTTFIGAEVSGLTFADVNDLHLFAQRSTSVGADQLRLYEYNLIVVYVTPPVADPVAPTGTIIANVPTIQWTDTLDTDGGAQTKYQVRIFTDAQYLAGGFNPATSTPTLDSGQLSGSNLSWVATAALPDDTYRAYVRVAQTVDGTDLWGEYDFTEFTIDVDVPGTPTLLATADNANARIALAITDNPGAASTDGFELQRSLDAGNTWAPLRTLDGDGLLDVPYVVAVSELADTADGTTHNVPLPAPPGGVLANDLLIAVSGMDGNPSFTWPSGWTEIKDEAGNGSAVRAGVAWKRADGGETGTIAVTTSVAEGGGTRILCVRGAHPTTAPEVSTGVNSAAANANPDALNPAGWATENTLWIAAMVLDGNVAVTAGPASYFNFGNTRWANAAGAGVATAELLSVAASADPGAFTQAAEDSRAFTVAVRPRNPSLTVWDYEAPNGTTVQYRARALHDYSGITAVGAWSAVDSEAWTSTSWWLKHPHRPDLNMIVVVRDLPEIRQASRDGIFQALGAARPIVVSDTRGAEEGEVTFRFLNAPDQAAFKALYEQVGTYLLQSPPGEGGPDYIRFRDRARQRIVPQFADASRVWETVQFIIVDSPAGDVAAWA